MIDKLTSAIIAAGKDSAVRVIILSARGKVFSSGHDLKEMTAGRNAPDGGKAYFTKVMSICSHMMQTIVNCPKPIIAEVAGIATAAGCQLVASCDLAVAANTAQFSTPGVHIGLFCSTPMVALSRNVSHKHAMEMLLTGDMISAARAAEIGLVNQVTEPDHLAEASQIMAQKIASKSSLTIATGKQAFYQQREMPLADAYSYASEVMVNNMMAQDAEEGINAFIEKRPAQWKDQ
jgi:enoyl-CoA hydratase/carnithine racemase